VQAYRKRLEDEQSPKVFNGLIEELNELIGETPGPAEGKKPIQIYRDLMPTHEAILRCAYCRLGNEFRPMIMRAEGWCQCEGCGHNAMPLDPEFRCTCAIAKAAPVHCTQRVVMQFEFVRE
jgi:hypothetical protein